MKKLFLTFSLSFLVIVAFAQTGTIRGKVTDQETGEELIGSTVIIKGTTTGAATDFEGNYAISNVAPGTYEIQFSYISYQNKVISNVVVTAGEVTILNVPLSTDSQQLQEVVVTAEVIRDTDAALVTVKRKSANVLDGISSETFKKIGDSDAASAIKRVPGVSIQGGKYVFVRGLGDRYTKTILNGMEIPGLDPDRNSIQMDIFPTNVVDNIIVKKSFTADLPADFTGGIVDVEIKDFPEEKTISFSGSMGVNSGMHFNDNYLTYDGGSTDFLGFDDGTRAIPFSSQSNLPREGLASSNPQLAQDLRTYTSAFDQTFAPTESTSSPNYSFGFSAGNQYNKDRYSIGFNSALNYRNTTEFYENAIDNSLYEKNADNSVNELDLDRKRTGSIGSNNVFISGLAGVAVKTDASKLKLAVLHVQNGESTSNRILEENFLQSFNKSERFAIQYTQRSITNAILSGEHYLGGSAITLDWKLTPTISSIQDKDVRQVPFTLEGEAREIQPSEGGNPRRLWRNLDEQNVSGKFSLTKEFQLNGNTSKLSVGSSYTFKNRDFTIDNFDFLVANEDQVSFGGDANNLLSPENIYDNGTGTYVAGTYQGSNSYSGEINNFGAFISGELALTENFKAIIGLRVEQFRQLYTGGDQDWFNSNGGQGIYYRNTEILNSFKPFPTANLIYNLNENSNLRGSYAKTIARPSFKEKSIAQIFDPLSNTFWIGNIDLIESDINNFDFRYEYYFRGGQTIAVSAFYKTFENPIEIVVVNQNTPDQFTARNNGNATVYGVEIEAKKNLEFISASLSNFNLNLNTSYIKSALKMDDVEYDARSNNLRDGETLERKRDMQGQSPYLVNAGLSYDNFDNGFEAALYYNVQGPSLARVGIGNIP
ncbi:TonB-dependent receptor, partial [Fulvivirga lutimaris]|uniref:TonB-dependent receptor n=1 Tax=Fulvivirga lutimaris TaxID=1819566 RepID=UPI0012BBFE58